MIKNNNLSFEIYESLKKTNKLNQLRFQKKEIHQSLCRYSLVDNLVNRFPYDYWVVITFGYFPQKHDIEVVLSNAHYRIDRWLLTNLKLNQLRIDQRSKWVCLPEKGSHGHLHYNCFIQLGEKPNTKSYGDEWHSMKDAFRTTFKSIEKLLGWKERTIQFKLYQRGGNQNALRQAMYSTKEMRESYIENSGDDHFANFIRSWVDFEVKPINWKSPKHLKTKPKSTGTLEEFFGN